MSDTITSFDYCLLLAPVSNGFDIFFCEDCVLQIESDLDGKTFQAFTHRYRYPAAESGSSSPHYYSFDLAGLSI